MTLLDPLKPTPIKHRLSFLHLERGNLDVLDGAFVLVDIQGVRTHIPVGSFTCLMLEPGIRVSHAAASLASRVGCLLLWVGEAGVRLYASGQPGGARSDLLLYQAKLFLDEQARLNIVRKMFELRFNEEPPSRRSIEQLRGLEGIRVKGLYKLFAQQYGVSWSGRSYDPTQWQNGDLVNRCISAANACLYGLTEAAVLAAGYSPSIGFLHTGKSLSFVYDIADIFKFETTVPVAFSVANSPERNIESTVRHKCRDMFRKTKFLKRVVDTIEEILAAGGLPIPAPYSDQVKPAIPEEKSGDDGHRS